MSRILYEGKSGASSRGWNGQNLNCSMIITWRASLAGTMIGSSSGQL